MNPKLHVSLDVANVEASVRFYSALFNAAPTKLRPGYAKFDIEQPAINLTMQQIERCCLQGLSHMGIRVESNAEIESYKSRLMAAGMAVEDEMNTTCCHAVQDKIWVNDPTGYRWEVYVFKGDVEERGAPKSSIGCACSAEVGCC